MKLIESDHIVDAIAYDTNVLYEQVGTESNTLII